MGDMNLEVLQAAAMQLPAAERAQLLSSLIASLDQDAALEAEWDALAAQREADLAQGGVELLSAQEVLQSLRAKMAA